jgi:tetrahydromethanopterin S-methyltransferase subunit F
MATGEKALVMKQTMTDEKLDEIKSIVEMKVSHRRQIIKRKAKWGFESNSTIGLNLGGAAGSILAEADAEEEIALDEPPLP